MKAHTLFVPALVLFSAFVPVADAASFAWIDVSLLSALAYDFVPKRDIPILTFGAMVVMVLALRAWTHAYFVFPHDVWVALMRVRP